MCWRGHGRKHLRSVTDVHDVADGREPPADGLRCRVGAGDGWTILVLEGELVTELSDGTVYTIPAGSSYQVGDDLSAHRSTAPRGARLFVVD